MVKNFARDFIGRRFHGKGEGIARLLKVGKLCGENCCSREVAVALAQTLADENRRALQVDNFDGQIFREALAVAFFECGAGEDDVFAFSVERNEAGMDGIEPGEAVSICQWNAVVHLGDVFGGMKFVGFEKHPGKPLG